jgi:hypothetical protein
MRLFRRASAKSILRFQDLSGREPALVFIRGRRSIGSTRKGVA